MQDFEPESILKGGNHSQKVMAPPIKSDYGSKDCDALPSSTAESRIIHERDKQEILRLKKMGWAFLILAIVTTGTAYALPDNQSIYWLSADGKQGFYVLSAFFAFLGFYCLGAIWRRRNYFI